MYVCMYVCNPLPLYCNGLERVYFYIHLTIQIGEKRGVKVVRMYVTYVCMYEKSFSISFCSLAAAKT